MSRESKKKLGLIVNPISGMGGSVGLKGTDGEDILKKAIELGAKPTSPSRAIEALNEVLPIKNHIELITYPRDMGEAEAQACGFEPKVIGALEEGKTSPEDTRDAARTMLKSEVNLILFVGGDGTARDIQEAIGDKLPVLGIPAGVKIHSGVFAINPKTAGLLAVAYLQDKLSTQESEVMDIDEEAFRHNRVSAKLYGYLRVPYENQMIQGTKTGSTTSEKEDIQSIAWQIIEDMEDDYLYMIGPGTTTKAIMRQLGLKYALLGVDVIRQKRLVASDVNEKQLLALTEENKTKIIVTVIGGQGHIFGRGNQQISSRVIEKVGKDNIVIIATENKIATLRGRPLLMDTDSPQVNKLLKGYSRIVTGYGRYIMYKVE